MVPQVRSKGSINPQITMKKYVIIWLLLSLIACHAKRENKVTEVSIRDRLLQDVESELMEEKEKLYFLSIVNRIPYDTIFQIVKDYKLYCLENELFLYESNNAVEKYDSVLMSFVTKYHLSKKKVASMLFSLKYEMRPPSDIISDTKNDQFADLPNDIDQ